ncbi:MAG TPA: choice-of-anchor D domain-containing protein [Ktedonobacteraceae bacterium]|nr:choice-of-anchor D domain-containing protein [Ktedonobacteraceae bacterium]
MIIVLLRMWHWVCRPTANVLRTRRDRSGCEEQTIRQPSRHRFPGFHTQLTIALAIMLLLGGLNFVFQPGAGTPNAHAKAADLNPIQIENNNPGTPGWNDFSASLQQDAISGFGSKISVNHGDSIDFYVTTTAPSFTIDIFRTGYYQGIGARLITSLGSFPGLHQAIPNPDPVTGIISCTNWAKTTTLQIPSSWVTGVYLAKLTTSTGNSSFIFFVVRNDGGTEDLLFQTSVTTYQAYNTWGGTSLYNNLTNGKIFSAPHATKVSFDRPFNPGDSNGAGHYFFFEYKFVYWLEEQGYNVSYITNVDTETNVNQLTNHKAFLSVGHDEYWSMGMRNNVQNAINSGVNVAFFSANTMYWQIRFEANSLGAADRVEVGYKDFATDTTPPGPDPMWHVNNSIVTTTWRDPTVNMPENAILGVMYEQQVDKDYAYVVQDASNWIYANTGFVNGSSVPGIVGYEYDKVYNNGSSPAGLTVLSNSPVHGCCGGFSSFSNSTLYTASSGARVFASGTIQWSWGLANIQGNTYMNAGIQQTTANILNNFINGPAPGIGLSPNSVNFGAQVVNTTSQPRAVTLTNTGTASLNISSINISGANAGDFAQTNNCPSSLAASATCTINVTFTPSSTGNRSANLNVADNAQGSPQGVALSGLGQNAPAPIVSLNPGSLSFGNQNVNTSSSPQVVTLTNTGTAALNISSIALSGTSAADFSQTNNCPNSLAVNANCTVNVTFAPATTGSKSASLTFTDNAGDSPESVPLTGTGVTPTPGDSLNPTSLSYNNQNVGTTSQPQTVTLTNNGTAALSISSIAITGANASDFGQTNNCPSSLAINASCTINVTFTPTANGIRNANVTITDNAPDSPVKVTLTGTGVTPITYFSDGFESGDFSNWTLPDGDSTGQKAVQSTVVNSGNDAAALTNTSGQYVYLYTALPGGAQNQTFTRFYFRMTSNTNGTILAVGRSASNGNIWEIDYNGNRHGLDIYFWNNSGGISSVFTANNVINANTWYSVELEDLETTSGLGQVWLNGTSVGSVNADLSTTTPYARLMFFDGAAGTYYFDDVIVSNLYNGPLPPMPRVNLSPTSVNFGNQNVGATSNPQTVTLVNKGSANLNISSMAITGTNAADFSLDSECPNSLAINATCTISVYFTPGATGTRSANLTLTDNAPDSPQSVALAGTGIVPAPIVSLDPTSLGFGNQNVGTMSAAQTVTLTNSGTLPLSISSIGINGANASDFAQTNNCPSSPSTLAVNASCTVYVNFDPGSAGSKSASLTFTDNAGDSPESVPLTGTGVVPAPAASLNPTSVTFSTQNVGTSSAPQGVTLSNTGTLSLTISSIAITGTNAGDFSQTNNCPSSLAIGASCTIDVTFTPTGNGARSAAVTLTDNAPDSPQSVALAGTGITPTIYFNDGFESGDFSNWTLPNGDSTGQLTVQSSVVHSGNDAAAITNTSGQYAYLYTAMPGGAQNSTFTRFSFQVSIVSNGTILAVGRSATNGNIWEIDYNGNRHGLDIYFWNSSGGTYSIFTANNVINANTWYTVELQDLETTSGHGQVWLNGTSVGSFDADLSTSAPFARLMLFDGAAGTYYFDDVEIANVYV